MKKFLLAVICGMVLTGQASLAQEVIDTSTQTSPAQARPFPQEARMAYVNIQMVAGESVEGKEAQERVGELNEQKVQELTVMNQELQALQEKLQQETSVLSTSARLEQEKGIERLQVDLQRFTEDAQAEVQALQQELQEEFQRELMPIIAQVASSMGLHMVFSQLDAGLVWADTGLDITVEIIAEFDRVSSIQADGKGTQLSKKRSAEF
jgi:Skp family chaperone for outer membrane proteins